MPTASARAAATQSNGQNQGGPQMSDNGRPQDTVLGEVVFGTVIKAARPKVAGVGKGRQPLPMDEKTLAALNLMLDNGGGENQSVNWKGTNFQFRQQVKSTFDKWAKAQEMRGVIVKAHYTTGALAGDKWITSPNKVSPSAADNEKEVYVNYYITVVDEKATVKA